MALMGQAYVMAQNGTGLVGDGYYRVHNKITDRYIYVTDNKDYYNQSTDAEDFQAIQLWKDASRTISDPGSVLYIEKHGSKYDIKAQNTGIYDFTSTYQENGVGLYVTITKITSGTYKDTYQVSASRGGVSKYLSDDKTNDNPQGKLGTSGAAKYRNWVVDKIDNNSETNYFGITPTVTLNGKYYQPFYASFPFKTLSPNMHVYYVSKVEGNKATLTEISGEIPASTPVIIECASNNPSNNRLELLNTSSAQVQDNKLAGVYFRNTQRPKESVDAYTKFNASTMRILTTVDGKLVFTNDDSSLETVKAMDWDTKKVVDIKCIPANGCYLMANAGTPAVLDIKFQGVGIDDILEDKAEKSAEGVYTLSGTQLRPTNDVQGLPAGLYIVGGVKFVVK